MSFFLRAMFFFCLLMCHHLQFLLRWLQALGAARQKIMHLFQLDMMTTMMQQTRQWFCGQTSQAEG